MVIVVVDVSVEVGGGLARLGWIVRRIIYWFVLGRGVGGVRSLVGRFQWCSIFTAWRIVSGLDWRRIVGGFGWRRIVGGLHWWRIIGRLCWRTIYS